MNVTHPSDLPPLDDIPAVVLHDVLFLRRTLDRLGPIDLAGGGHYARAVFEGWARGLFTVVVLPCGRRYRVANADPVRHRKGDR